MIDDVRNKDAQNKLSLVAHRGEPLSFPENSLPGFSHALQSGARYLETDINITADEVVVLSHDKTLKKLTGRDISITENHYSVFSDLAAGYPARFSDKFMHCRIATLAQLVELLKDWPQVTCFIELKQHSLSCFGKRVVDLVATTLQPIAEQAVLISFDYEALAYARDHYQFPLGWVLPGWSDGNQLKAQKLAAHYLFVATDFCPQTKEAFWPGPWQWVVYTVNTLQAVRHYELLGISLIESDCVSELLTAMNIDK